MGIVSGVIRQMDNEHVAFRCPGCERMHVLRLRAPGRDGHTWEWNRSHSKPTFTPSIHVNPPGPSHDPHTKTCHSFVREGRIQFLADSQHALACETVPLPSLED